MGGEGDGFNSFRLFTLELSINLLLHTICDEASTSVVSFHIGSPFHSCQTGSRKHYAQGLCKGPSYLRCPICKFEAMIVELIGFSLKFYIGGEDYALSATRIWVFIPCMSPLDVCPICEL